MQALVATEQIIRAAENIFQDYEVTKLRVYQARPGNPNQIEIANFGDTLATLSPIIPQFDRVYGFTEKDIPVLPEIVRFYERTRTAFELTVSPLDASPAVSAALIAAGFVPEYYQARLFGALPLHPISKREGLQVKVSRVEPDSIDEYLDLMLESWDTPSSGWEIVKDNMRLRLQVPGMSLFWGSVDGEKIGGCVLYVRGSVGYLAETATASTHRCKGCQRALILARAAQAQVMGCRELYGSSRFGDTSFRNMQRAGMHLASSEQTWHFRFGEMGR